MKFISLSFCPPLSLKAQTEAKEEAKKVKVKLQRTMTECEIALSTVEKEKERCRLLEEDVVDLTATLQEFTQKADVTCHIRHKEQRGKPMKDTFVRHCRTLLATGASARSVREQLLLNAGFFLRDKEYAIFSAAIPSIRYFQLQREGMGNESVVYSWIAIAKCEEVCQWGFDETSLNGIPTLNQWCRIKEGGEYRNVTIECAGLLPGSTSSKVAEHVKFTWERGQRLMELVRTELGVSDADALLPLVNGGVSMTKLRGAMHDTCNCANLVAKKVRVLRDDAGKDMFGAEEWASMQERGHGWMDFLCANHSRNLHFDAFARVYTDYIKGLFGDSLSVAKARSGGRLRIEPDGESFVRSICKLTHVGPKQYEKGRPSP